MPSFGQWKYSIDRNATVDAYDRVERGGADTCACIHCRNFSVARTQMFPEEFRVVLSNLGIDPYKDAEVFHCGRLATGRHSYGGWYHFIGSLNESGDFPPVVFDGGFTAWMRRPAGPRISTLEGKQVVQLEFHAQTVPWLLDEPEPAEANPTNR